MIGTDLYLVSDMPIRIRWAKVLALHAKYHADDAFIITGAPDLTCSLDKITCFDDAAADIIRPAHELRAQLFILQNIPVACRPVSVTFVMDLARFRTMRRRLAVWHDGMTHYIMPLRAMVDRLAGHHQTRQLERQTRERLLLGHSQDRRWVEQP